MCDRFPRKFDVQTSYKPSNVIFVVNIKFPRATYHTIVHSTEELYCLNSAPKACILRTMCWTSISENYSYAQYSSFILHRMDSTHDIRLLKKLILVESSPFTISLVIYSFSLANSRIHEKWMCILICSHLNRSKNILDVRQVKRSI